MISLCRIRISRTRRSGRTIAAVLGFLVLFALLVLITSKFYLIPALQNVQHSTHAHRRLMAARSLLLLAVLLTILFVGLLITFRPSRFFFPPTTGKPSKTKVVDAWAEAGKRIGDEEAHDEE